MRPGRRASRLRIVAAALPLFLPFDAALAQQGNSLGQTNGLEEGATEPRGFGSSLTDGAGLSPYVDTRIVADLDSIGSNFRTYANIAAGLDAFVRRERVQGTLTSRLDYRQPISGDGKDRFDVHLLGRGQAEIVRQLFFVEASAFAGLINRDPQRGYSFDPTQTNSNYAQTYAFTVSPRLEHQFGSSLRGAASYKFSAVDVDDSGNGSSGGGGGSGGAGGIAGSNTYSDSIGHELNGSFGTVPNATRLSAVLSGNATHTDQARLEERYRAYRGTLDLGYAINPKLNVLGAVGYEYYKSTQQAVAFGLNYLVSDPAGLIPLGSPANPDLFLRQLPGVDPAGGSPVPILDYTVPDLGFDYSGPPGFLLNGFGTGQLIDGFDTPSNLVFVGGQLVPVSFGPLFDPNTGQFIPDPAGGRRTLYQNDGLVWNAGFRFQPSSRGLVEIRVGQRFGDLTVTGSINYKIRPLLILSGKLTDGIQNYGTVVTDTIDGVSTSFTTGRNGGRELGGCIIGQDPANPGSCIDDAIQSVTGGVFRSRIGELGLHAGSAKRRAALVFSYSEREYLTTNSDLLPGTPPIDFGGRKDISYRLHAIYSQQLGARQQISLNATAGINEFGLRRDQREDYYLHGGARYNAKLAERLSFVSSVAVTQRFSKSIQNDLNATATAGLRYEF